MVFVKWLTEESGFAYNEGGIPIELADNDYPDAYEAFGDVILFQMSLQQQVKKIY